MASLVHLGPPRGGGVTVFPVSLFTVTPLLQGCEERDCPRSTDTQPQIAPSPPFPRLRRENRVLFSLIPTPPVSHQLPDSVKKKSNPESDPLSPPSAPTRNPAGATCLSPTSASAHFQSTCTSAASRAAESVGQST